MTTKTIVVFAATGLQGSALIKFLSRYNTPTPTWHILALTRNTTSPSARALSQYPGVKVVEVADDCMDRPSACFAQLGLRKGDVYGVFSNQGYVNDKTMIKQGIAIADAAHELGVEHLVYSSNETGGADDCGLPIIQVKRMVEDHISKLAPMAYTFLRPVQFMDSYVPTSPYMFKISRTVVMRYTFYKNPQRKHQLISSRDIGCAGAEAFVRGPKWMDGQIGLAGDSLTIKEIDKIFFEELGQPVTLTFGPIAWVSGTVVPVLRDMRKFFDEYGYHVDVDGLRKDLPELEDLRTFLRRYKAEQDRSS